jgi:hypothetical protein
VIYSFRGTSLGVEVDLGYLCCGLWDFFVGSETVLEDCERVDADSLFSNISCKFNIC